MAQQKVFFGGRVDKDGFHKLDKASAYPALGAGTGIVVKLGTSSLYGRKSVSLDRTTPQALTLGYKYRNPQVYRKWYRPTLLEIHVAALNDPKFAYYVWKWSEYFSTELIFVGETKEEYLSRKKLDINSNYGK